MGEDTVFSPDELKISTSTRSFKDKINLLLLNHFKTLISGNELLIVMTNTQQRDDAIDLLTARGWKTEIKDSVSFYNWI